MHRNFLISLLQIYFTVNFWNDGKEQVLWSTLKNFGHSFVEKLGLQFQIFEISKVLNI